jgi:hypothetical protein
VNTEASDGHLEDLQARQARQAPRRCLGPCGRLFPSEGPWNRICPECARRNRHRSVEAAPLPLHLADPDAAPGELG